MPIKFGLSLTPVAYFGRFVPKINLISEDLGLSASGYGLRAGRKSKFMEKVKPPLPVKGLAA